MELESHGKKPSSQHSLLTLEKIHLVGDDRFPETAKESSKSIAWISSEDRSWRATTNHEFVVSLDDSSKSTQWLVVLSAVNESGAIHSLQTRMLSLDPQKPVVTLQLSAQVPTGSTRQEVPIWHIAATLIISAIGVLAFGILRMKAKDVKEKEEEQSASESHTSATDLAVATQVVQPELPVTQPDMPISSNLIGQVMQNGSPAKSTLSLPRTPTNDASSNEDSGTELSRQLESEQDSGEDEDDWWKPPKIQRNKVHAKHPYPQYTQSSQFPLFDEKNSSGFHDALKYNATLPKSNNCSTQTCHAEATENQFPTCFQNQPASLTQFPGTLGAELSSYVDSSRRFTAATLSSSKLRPLSVTRDTKSFQQNDQSEINRSSAAASVHSFGKLLKDRVGGFAVKSKQGTDAERPCAFSHSLTPDQSIKPGEPRVFPNSAYTNQLPSIFGRELLPKTNLVRLPPRETDKTIEQINTKPVMDDPKSTETREFGTLFGQGFMARPLSSSNESLPILFDRATRSASQAFDTPLVNNASCDLAGLSITNDKSISRGKQKLPHRLQSDSWVLQPIVQGKRCEAKDLFSNSRFSWYPAVSEQTTHPKSFQVSSSSTPLVPLAKSIVGNSYPKAVDESLSPKANNLGLDPSEPLIGAVNRNFREGASERDAPVIEHGPTQLVTANEVVRRISHVHLHDVSTQNKNLPRATDERCPVEIQNCKTSEVLMKDVSRQGLEGEQPRRRESLVANATAEVVEHHSDGEPKDASNSNSLVIKASSGGPVTCHIAIEERQASRRIDSENPRIKSEVTQQVGFTSHDSTADDGIPDPSCQETSRKCRQQAAPNLTFPSQSEKNTGRRYQMQGESARFHSAGTSSKKTPKVIVQGTSTSTQSSSSPKQGSSNVEKEQNSIQESTGKPLSTDNDVDATVSSQQSSNEDGTKQGRDLVSARQSNPSDTTSTSKNYCSQKQPIGQGGHQSRATTKTADCFPPKDDSTFSANPPRLDYTTTAQGNGVTEDLELDDQKAPKLQKEMGESTKPRSQGKSPSRRLTTTAVPSRASKIADKEVAESSFMIAHGASGSVMPLHNTDGSRNTTSSKPESCGQRRFGSSGALAGVQDRLMPTRTKYFTTDISTCSTLPPHSDCTPTPESIAKARPPKTLALPTADDGSQDNLEFESYQSPIQRCGKRRSRGTADQHSCNKKSQRDGTNVGKKPKPARSRDPIPEVPVSASLRAVHKAETAEERTTALRTKKKKRSIPRTIEIPDESKSLASKDSALVDHKKRKLNSATKRSRHSKKGRVPNRI